MMTGWEILPGETPVDISGLKAKGVPNRAQLNVLEAAGIRKVVVKYLAKKPSRRTAPFDLSWVRKLHKEMFGKVWDWAGMFRTRDVNIGLPWHQVETSLQTLLDNLHYRHEQGADI